MFSIETPYERIDRSSRLMKDPDNFTSVKGGVVAIVDGKVENVTVGTDPKVALICITGVSGNVYEGHDVKAGRITVLESYGTRFQADAEVVDGAPVAGDFLAPSTVEDKTGKLEKASGNTAIAQVIAVSNGVFECKTISPTLVA